MYHFYSMDKTRYFTAENTIKLQTLMMMMMMMMMMMIFSSFHCRQGKRPPPEKGKGKKKGKDGNEADSESEEGKKENNFKLKLFKYFKGSLLAKNIRHIHQYFWGFFSTSLC